jgi:hypothetical protein
MGSGALAKQQNVCGELQTVEDDDDNEQYETESTDVFSDDKDLDVESTTVWESDGITTEAAHRHGQDWESESTTSWDSLESWKTGFDIVDREADRANAVMSNTKMLIEEGGHRCIGMQEPLVQYKRAAVDRRREQENQRDEEAAACARGLLAMRTLACHEIAPLARVGKEALINISDFLAKPKIADPGPAIADPPDMSSERTPCIDIGLFLSLYPIDFDNLDENSPPKSEASTPGLTRADDIKPADGEARLHMFHEQTIKRVLKH